MKLSDPRHDLASARVLSWAAVSTKAQDKYSIDDQLKLEREWCAKTGARVIDELVVRGFSRDYWTLADVVAASAHDPDMEAFARLQAHIRKQSFNVFLCFDADRFGRTASLVHEVIGRITRDCHALIYTLFDGVWMDEENAPMIGTMKAYNAQAAVTKLRDYRETGMHNRARDGKSTSADLPLFQKRVRDEKGKEVGVIVNEDLRPLWTDLATLILRGVSWNDMEQVLFAEFGHGLAGKPYVWGTMRRMVLHFAFWGHAALNYRLKDKQRIRSMGAWVWDEQRAAPPPITVYRNRYPAVYSGQWAELGERVKDELARRDTLRGKATARNTYRFHGLLVCDECGFTLNKAVSSKNPNRVYLRCETRYGTGVRRSATCAQSKHIRAEVVQAYFHTQLEQRLEGLPSSLFDTLDDTDTLQARIADAERQRTQVQKRADSLVAELSAAPENLRPIFRRQIADLSAHLEQIENSLESYRGEFASQRDAHEAQARVLAQLETEGLNWLWQQPDTTMHQLLCLALGDNQLVVRDGQIIGVAPAHSNAVRFNRRAN